MFGLWKAAPLGAKRVSLTNHSACIISSYSPSFLSSVMGPPKFFGHCRGTTPPTHILPLTPSRPFQVESGDILVAKQKWFSLHNNHHRASRSPQLRRARTRVRLKPTFTFSIRERFCSFGGVRSELVGEHKKSTSWTWAVLSGCPSTQERCGGSWLTSSGLLLIFMFTTIRYAMHPLTRSYRVDLVLPEVNCHLDISLGLD